jgi:hypothetical protein
VARDKLSAARRRSSRDRPDIVRETIITVIGMEEGFSDTRLALAAGLKSRIELLPEYP